MAAVSMGSSKPHEPSTTMPSSDEWRVVVAGTGAEGVLPGLA